MAEILQSYWLVTLVLNSIDHTVENHVLKTIDNNLNHDLLSFETLKARSHDPFLRIRFLVPKTGSRRSHGPISRFRFCDENVGRSFVVCSHDPFVRTNKESSIWRQNDHTKFVGALHLSRRVSDENRACSISIRFYKVTDPFD